MSHEALCATTSTSSPAHLEGRFLLGAQRLVQLAQPHVECAKGQVEVCGCGGQRGIERGSREKFGVHRA